MKWLVLLPILLIGCTTIKETTTTQTRVVRDTIYVVDKEWQDSVKAVWEDSLTSVGVFLDENKDTTIVVKYIPGRDVFHIKKYTDTLKTVVTRVDTVQVINRMEEPTFLEQYWWLFLMVGVIGIGVVIIIILKR